MQAWRKFFLPGDWLFLFFSAAFVALLYPWLWQGGSAEKLVVRRDGKVIAEFALSQAKRFTVQGELGATVIEVQPGRARIAEDPGPRQYCVKQGWLTRANAVAICAPSHISLSLVGKMPGYDSLNY